jgi:general secretion pathway protein M
MNVSNQIKNYLSRFPLGATVLYVVSIILLIAMTAGQITDVWQRFDAVTAATDGLNALEGRNAPRSTALGAADVAMVSGSPYIEGATLTVAGATLLQRLTGAVTRVGGGVQSSQVDVQGAESTQGFVTATANCELDQPALQQLLYDLEAGMPFLFVEQLVAQAPAATITGPSGNGLGKLRVLITVSGQWRGEK